MKFYPLPNRTPTTDLPGELREPATLRTPDGRALRAVWTISSPAIISFSSGMAGITVWTHPRLSTENAAGRPAIPTDGQDEFERGNIAAASGYTWIASPRTVIDFRFGFTRYFEANLMYGEGFDIATLGFPESFARSDRFATFPRFEMSGDVSNLGAGRVTTRQFINQYNPLVNFHTSLGRHALKYGFRYQIAPAEQFRARTAPAASSASTAF